MGDEQELLVKIAADAVKAVDELQSLRRGLSDVGDAASKSARQFTDAEKAATALGKVIGGALATAVTVAVTALTAFGYASVRAAKDFAAWQEQLRNTAQQLGVSTDFVQALESKVKDLGLGVGTATVAVRQFSTTIQQALERGSEMGKAFARLKVSLRDDDGKVRATEAIFTDMARALGRMEDGAAKTAAAKRLLGRQGALLLPLFNELTKSTGNWVEEMRKAGVIIDRDLLDAGQRLDDQLDSISTAGDALKKTFGALASEAITPLAKGIAGDLQKGLKWLIDNKATVTGAVKTIADAFGGMYAAVSGLTETVLPAFLEFLDLFQKKREVLPDFTDEALRATLQKEQDLAAAQIRIARMYQGNEGQPFAKNARQAAREAQARAAEAERYLGLPLSMRPSRVVEADYGEDTMFRPPSDGVGTGGSTDDPLAGLFGGGGGDDKLAEKLRENLQAALAVLRDAANQQILIETELTQGKKVALEVRLKQTLESVEIERKATIEAAKAQVGGAELTAKELASINSAADAQSEAAKAEHATRMIQYDEQMRDARKDAIESISDLEVEAFGDAQVQAVYKLNQAQEQLLETLKELQKNQAITGAEFEAMAGRASAAYDRLRDDVNAVTIDIGSTLTSGIGQAFTGIIAGTRDLDDAIAAFGESMVSQMGQAFAEMLVKKSGFDTTFKLNMTRDLPEMAAQGAESVGNIWSSLFSFLGGGSGVGSGVSVSTAGVTAVNGGSAGGMSGAYAQLAPLAQMALGGPSAAGFLSTLSPGTAAGGGSAAAMTGFGGGGGGLFGSSLGINGGGGFVDAIIGGSGRGGIGGLGSSLLSGGASLFTSIAPSIAGFLGVGGGGAGAMAAAQAAAGLAYTPAAGGGLATAGVAQGLGVGGAAPAAGGAGIGAAAGGAIAAGVILGLMGVAEGAKLSTPTTNRTQRRRAQFSLSDPVMTGLSSAIGINNEETEIISGILSVGLSQILTQAAEKLHIFKAPMAEGVLGDSVGGFLKNVGIPIPDAAGGRDGPSIQAYTGSNDRYFPQVPLPESYKNIDRTGAQALSSWAFRDVLYPKVTRGGTPELVEEGPVQGIFNTAAALGLGEEDTRDLLRTFVRATATRDVEKDQDPFKGAVFSAANFKKNSETGKWASQDVIDQTFQDRMAAIVDAFVDLPPAVDAAKLALLLFDKEGHIAFEAFKRQIEAAVQLADALDLGSTLQSSMASGGGMLGYQTRLRGNARQGAVDTVFSNLNDSKGVGAPFKAFNATVIEAGEAFRDGDLERGNELIARARGEYEAATKAAGDYFQKIKDEAPAVIDLLRETAAESAAIEIASNALAAATQVLTDSLTESGEQAKRQAELEAALNDKRIAALEISIEQAKAWGDEVGAAQMEMERQSLVSQQQLAKDAQDPSAVFMKAMKSQLQEQVVSAVITGLLEAGGVQGIIQPVLEAIFAGGEVLANPNATPDQIAGVFANIKAASDIAGPALKMVTENMMGVFDVLEKSGVLDFNGISVAKPMAAGGIVTSPTLALIGEAGPEAVIPLGRGGSAFAPTINVSVTLNGTLDQYSASMFADQIASVSMRQLKQNRLLGYN